MDVYQVKKSLAKGEVLLIDVRETEEYDEAHILQAVHIPLRQVSLQALPKTNLPIVIYCRSGKRSAAACQIILDDAAEMAVYNMTGGILAWQQAGFEVIRDK